MRNAIGDLIEDGKAEGTIRGKVEGENSDNSFLSIPPPHDIMLPDVNFIATWRHSSAGRAFA